MLQPLIILGALLVGSFLLGSIPWGVIVSRIAFHKDIRQEGSGNIGATNALRTMGKAGGAAVFLLDFGKGLCAGFLATLVAAWLASPSLAGTEPMMTYALLGMGFEKAFALHAAQGAAWSVPLSLGFLGCVCGHIFSPWLKFHGGKGISVAVGYLFFLFGPLWALVEIGIFAIIVALTRYVSAGSVAAAIACPFIGLLLFWGQWFAVALITVSALTVIWAHRGNLQRLAHGEERKLGSKQGKSAA